MLQIAKRFFRYAGGGARRRVERADDGPLMLTMNGLAHEITSLKQRMGHAETHIGSAWQRLEFVRAEILYEFAHGARGNEPSKTDPNVAATVKIGEMKAKNALKLNLGCGHIPMKDYINVDMRNLPGVDIVTAVDDLPFEANTIDEIFSSHILEHFPQEALMRRLLPYWLGLLKPGGCFRAITPDADAMLAGISAKTYPFETFRNVVFGGQDYEGDYHFNLLTPDSLKQALKTVGYTNISIVESGRRNGLCFEFEIVAFRGQGST